MLDLESTLTCIVSYMMNKQLLTIGQLSEITGLSTHALRYYERIGVLKDVQRTSNGRRYYTLWHLGWLEFVMRMRSTGMPLPEIIRYADLYEEGDSTIQTRLELLENHQAEVETKLENLHRDLQAIQDKIALYKSLNMPEDDQPKKGHRWSLQLNPDATINPVDKIPSVIIDILSAKSLQDGLPYVNEIDHGWNWTSKYRFLETNQFLRQIFPDLTWHVSAVSQQGNIYAFTAQPSGTPTHRKYIVFRGEKYEMPLADFDFCLPASQILMRIVDGCIVELHGDFADNLQIWLNDFLERAIRSQEAVQP